MDFLSEIERQLDLPPAEKEQVMRELRSHDEELEAEFIASGLGPDAANVAARRLGDPRDIGARRGLASRGRGASVRYGPGLRIRAESRSGDGIQSQDRGYADLGGIHPHALRASAFPAKAVRAVIWRIRVRRDKKEWTSGKDRVSR